jgi:PII-like signaling protein
MRYAWRGPLPVWHWHGCYKMPNGMAVQVTIYLTEGDRWHGKPMHMEILNYLRKENAYVAIALHGAAGFIGRHRVESSHLVDTGGRLPIVVVFVDTDEHVTRLLPTLKEIAANRLIVRENVVIEQGSLA